MKIDELSFAKPIYENIKAQVVSLFLYESAIFKI